MSDHPMDQHPLGAMSYERPMTSPSPRKPRNAKGLALKLPGFGDPQQASAPASPSFVKPPLPKPRKKPSILSLQTSANPNPITRLTLDPPPTPGFGRLKHSHSSPQMALFSPDPRGGPEGGMQLPALQRSRVSGLSTTFRKPSALKESNLGAPIDEEESPIKTQMATRSQTDIRGDIFDAPASQEDAQSPGYPQGPVEIYSPNVFLYLEPTADEAARFDVIMNVAREVKNPFKASLESSEAPKSAEPKASFDPMEVDRENIPEPDTAASTMTFQTAFEYPMDSQQTPTESSPTTPKPNSKPEPEYFHIPWDHNTDISKDLMDLCETIEARTKEGKRVLVHCQQGASRSASLIIAYGIYMNPTLSVNDAYHAAQAKSKWISPNMKLMYALQDFQKEVERKKLLSVSSAGKGGRHLDRRSPTKHRMTMSADAVESSPREPQTAPLPSENDKDSRHGGMGGMGGIGASTGHTPVRPSSTPDFGAISPGPSSAPSSYAWTPKGTPGAEKDSSPRTEFVGLWGSDPKSSEQERTPSEQLKPQPFLRPSSSFTGFSPPSSLSPTPPNSGFGSHRKEHNLTLPSLSLASSSSSSSSGTSNTTPKASSSDIKPQFATLPPSFGSGFGGLGNAIPQTPSLWSPRIQEMTAHPLRPAPVPAFEEYDVPPTPNLMSPRATEFTMTPFARPTLPGPSRSFGSTPPQAHIFSQFPAGATTTQTPIPNFSRPRPFGMHSPPAAAVKEVAESLGFATPERPAREASGFGFGGTPSRVPKEVTPPKKIDPRSPAMKGEVGAIIRSIDDVL